MRQVFFFIVIMICINIFCIQPAVEDLEKQLQQNSCGPEGNAKTAKEKAINKLKNRPVSILLPEASYSSLFDLLVADTDTVKYKQGQYISITGYVVEGISGGSESCNCGSNKEEDHTTYLYIGRSIDSPKNECVLVAVTPAYKNGKPKLIIYKGVKYYVEGYLLYNAHHIQAPVLKQQGWQIYPVCKLSSI